MRSNAEWEELRKALLLIVIDPKETKERIDKAQSILDKHWGSSGAMGSTLALRQSRGKQSDTRGHAAWTDAEYDGTIV